MSEWYPGQYDRSWDARGDDEERRMAEDEAAYFRNRSLRPSVLLSRLWHFVRWTLVLEPYGRLRGWW